MKIRILGLALFTLILSFVIPYSASASNLDGALDIPFTSQVESSTQAGVLDVESLAGGKSVTLLADGNYSIYKFNSDGTRDSQLNTLPFDDTAASISVDTNGKIIVGGMFAQYGANNVYGLVRINPDGSIAQSLTGDHLFDGSSMSGRINHVVALPNGKILVAGEFSQFNGVAATDIVRLNSDGTIDSSFSPVSLPAGNLRAVLPTSDGGMFLSGLNGNSAYYFKLTISGGLDSSFATVHCTYGSGQAVVSASSIRNDGSLVLVGDFSQCANHTSTGIIGISSAGLFDSSLQTGVGLTGGVSGEYGTDVQVQPNGNILLIGVFSGYQSTSTNGIVRLLPTGAIDPTFALSGGFGVNNQGRAIALESDGGILIGGLLDSFNGNTVGGLIRLYNAPNNLPTPYPTNLAETGISSQQFVTQAITGLVMTLLGLGGFFISRRILLTRQRSRTH